MKVPNLEQLIVDVEKSKDYAILKSDCLRRLLVGFSTNEWTRQSTVSIQVVQEKVHECLDGGYSYNYTMANDISIELMKKYGHVRALFPGCHTIEDKAGAVIILDLISAIKNING